MQALQVIEMFAGTRPDGETVVERLRVKINEDDTCQLVTSPAFVKGIARGDTLKRNGDSFELVKRSGNLCIRIYSDKLEDISQELTPALEKLGGELDIETPRFYVYSIHVSCGFTKIEELLNKYMADRGMWMYGNVYDPEDGTTPLNWWQSILAPE